MVMCVRKGLVMYSFAGEREMFMCMLEGILVIIYVFVFDRIIRHTHLHVCIFQTLLLILM